jgi:hypothetical protein
VPDPDSLKDTGAKGVGSPNGDALSQSFTINLYKWTDTDADTAVDQGELKFFAVISTVRELRCLSV